MLCNPLDTFSSFLLKKYRKTNYHYDILLQATAIGKSIFILNNLNIYQPDFIDYSINIYEENLWDICRIWHKLNSNLILLTVFLEMCLF